MLQIDSLTFSYPRNPRKVISDMTLALPDGGIYGLLGANGTGKSTLLYLISGLLRPDAGSVTFDGINTARRLPDTLADLFIVPEDIYMPPIKLKDFVALNAPFYKNFSQDELNNYLEHFRLTPDIHLGRLSMGQKKKAYIAFALACNTKLLLMDEPTNGLDIPGKSEFRRAIVSAATDKRTIIISTHQVRDLDRILDHLVIINESGVQLNASVSQLQQRYVFLFTHNPADLQGALWSQPVPGGFNVIKTRTPEMEETDVNLESLFEFAFFNPQIAQAL